MSNELVPKDIGGQVAKYDLNEIASGSGGYLHRMQLFGSKSGACAKGLIPMGHWGIVTDDKIIDLGAEVDFVAITWRPKALDTSDGVVTSHDPESSLYQDIAARSAIKDSGCMSGPEFLVWVPAQQSFHTWFANSASACRAAKRELAKLMQQPATGKAELVTKGKNTWHAPVFVPCSTTFDPIPVEALTAEVAKFKNPGPEQVLAEGNTTGREV